MVKEQQEPKDKNHSHLVQQNIHLRNQVLTMRSILQKVLFAADDSQTDTPAILLQREQIATQARQLHKFKQQIAELKAGNCKQNAAYIRKEEDDLTFIKQELSAALRERDCMQKQISEKKKALETNKPLDQQLQRITEECTKVRKNNRESAHKIVEIEREIRKYHQISTCGKNGMDEDVTIKEGSMGDIEAMNKNMKEIQQKWRPLMTQIDDEYLVLKGKLKLGEMSMDKAEKEENVWRGRANSLRDEDNLKKDKERLAKIHADNPFIIPVKEENPRLFLKKGENQRNSVGDAFQQIMLKPRNQPTIAIETPFKEIVDTPIKKVVETPVKKFAETQVKKVGDTPVKKAVDAIPMKSSKSLGAELANKIQMKAQEVKKFNQNWGLTDQIPIAAKIAPKSERKSTEIIVKAIAQKIAIEVAKRNLSPQPQRTVVSPPKASNQRHSSKESQKIIEIMKSANIKQILRGNSAQKKSVAPQLPAPKKSISLAQKSLPSIQESTFEHNPSNFRYQICISDIKKPSVSKELHSKRAIR